MLRYLAKRLAAAVVTLLGVTLLAFVVLYRLPADPAVVIAGPVGSANPELLANIRRTRRLDRPVWEQYGTFLSQVARGDLGTSYVSNQPVAQTIARRLPATLQLAVAGWLCWLVLGTAFGVWAAARPGPVRDGALLGFSILGVSTPTFWVGILLLYLFVIRLNLFPAGGSGTPKHLVLPTAALALSGVAYYARLTHASMRGVLGEDFIRTAVAKGVTPLGVLFRHALRNALLPLVTVAGADLAALLGGVVFTETVFDWQGMGQLAVQAVRSSDIPVILGVVLVSAAFVVTANLVVDLLYPILDPRIRAGGMGDEA
ncbi:MAG: ABC transporter permease [Armatimonadota bacterium]